MVVSLTMPVPSLRRVYVNRPRPGQGVQPQLCHLPLTLSLVDSKHLKTCRQALEDRAGIAKDQRREAIRARAASSSPSLASPSNKASPFLPSPGSLSEAEVLRQRELGNSGARLRDCPPSHSALSQKPLHFLPKILNQTQVPRPPAPFRFWCRLQSRALTRRYFATTTARWGQRTSSCCLTCLPVSIEGLPLKYCNYEWLLRHSPHAQLLRRALPRIGNSGFRE